MEYECEIHIIYTIPLIFTVSILNIMYIRGRLFIYTSLHPYTGETAIDLALSSGYKELASKLAKAAYIQTRSQVSRSYKYKCTTTILLLYISNSYDIVIYYVWNAAAYMCVSLLSYNCCDVYVYAYIYIYTYIEST